MEINSGIRSNGAMHMWMLNSYMTERNLNVKTFGSTQRKPYESYINYTVLAQRLKYGTMQIEYCFSVLCDHTLV